MSRLSIASTSFIAGLALMQMASAADLPRKAPDYTAPLPFNWTGFYVGVNAGGHLGRDEITTTGNQAGFAGAAGLDSLSPVALKPDGFIGGIQLGYNWQINSFVLGIEGDAAWLSGNNSRTLVFPGPVPEAGDVLTNSIENRFLGTVRGRFGIGFDRALLYATGGIAFGSLKTNNSMCIQGCPGTAATFASVENTTTRTGWTVGAGLEYAFAPNWTARGSNISMSIWVTSTPPSQAQQDVLGALFAISRSTTVTLTMSCAPA